MTSPMLFLPGPVPVRQGPAPVRRRRPRSRSSKARRPESFRPGSRGGRLAIVPGPWRREPCGDGFRVRETAPSYEAGTADAPASAPDPGSAAEAAGDAGRSAGAIHESILRLVAAQRRADWELLTRFREMEDVAGHLDYGCRTMNAYVALVLGVNEMAARERMRVARALADLPRIDGALRAGRISYAKARAVTRVATAESEEAWLASALELTAEELEWQVARSRKGERRPSQLWMDPVDDRMTRLVVELPADEMEMVHQAIEKVRRVAGGAVSSSQALLYMAAEMLNTDFGEIQTADHFQVVVHLEGGVSGGAGGHGGVESAPEARVSKEDGVASGGTDVSAETGPRGEGALSDRSVSAETATPGAVAGSEPSVSAETAVADPAHGGGSDVSAETKAEAVMAGSEPNVSAETARPPAGRVGTSCGTATLPPEKIAQLLCDGSVVAAQHLEDGSLQVSQRVRTIPTATRRAILWRDGRRCRVPACRNRLWLDLHHRKPWWSGGSHTQENLVTLCRQHHSALHEGELRIEAPAEPGGRLRFFAGNWEMRDGTS